jgi:hypothetical protein
LQKDFGLNIAVKVGKASFLRITQAFCGKNGFVRATVEF